MPLPDDVYGFGWAEIRYLLGRHATESSRMTVASLGFDAAPTDELVGAAGVASLLARGLAQPEGDHAVSRGEAAVLETVFARAKRWSGISVRDGDTGDLMVVIEDGDIIALLQPRSLGTWFVGLTDAVDRPAEVLARAVEQLRAAHGSTSRFAIETRTLEGSVGTRYFRPTTRAGPSPTSATRSRDRWSTASSASSRSCCPEHPRERAHPSAERGARPSDPPPYAWLDDPAQPFGPVGIRTTVVIGSALGAMGLFGLAFGLFGGDQGRAARLGVGIVFVLIGAVVVRMGTARRAWRARNPGVDPLAAAVESGANVGSAFGDQSRVGRVGRWLLVAVCAFVTIVMALALRRAVTGETPTSAGAMVVIVLLGLFAAVIGVMAAVRTRPPRG